MQGSGIDWTNQAVSLAIAVVAPILTSLLLSFARPVRALISFRFAKYNEAIEADALSVVRSHLKRGGGERDFYKMIAGLLGFTLVMALFGAASIYMVINLLGGSDVAGAGDQLAAFRSGFFRLVALAFFSFIGAMTMIGLPMSIHTYARAMWIFANRDKFAKALAGEVSSTANRQ